MTQQRVTSSVLHIAVGAATSGLVSALQFFLLHRPPKTDFVPPHLSFLQHTHDTMTEHSSKKRKTNNKAAAPTKAAPAPPKPVRIRQPSSNRKRTPVAAPDALPTCNENASSFGDLGLPDGIQRSVANLGLSSFSAVQKAVIAPFYNNKDVCFSYSVCQSWPPN